jgi:hypothetical protein
VCREVWSAIGAGRAAHSLLAQTAQADDSAREFLGDGHPLVRVLHRTSQAIRHVLAVALILVLASAAWLDGARGALPLIAAALVVEVTLALRIASLVWLARERACDLIIQGRADLPLDVVRRQRRRLLDRRLARTSPTGSIGPGRPPSARAGPNTSRRRSTTLPSSSRSAASSPTSPRDCARRRLASAESRSSSGCSARVARRCTVEASPHSGRSFGGSGSCSAPDVARSAFRVCPPRPRSRPIRNVPGLHARVDALDAVAADHAPSRRCPMAGGSGDRRRRRATGGIARGVRYLSDTPRRHRADCSRRRDRAGLPVGPRAAARATPGRRRRPRPPRPPTPTAPAAPITPPPRRRGGSRRPKRSRRSDRRAPRACRAADRRASRACGSCPCGGSPRSGAAARPS